LKSRPTRPHPLFVGFVGAALAYNDAERLPVDVEASGNRTAATPVATATVNGASVVASNGAASGSLAGGAR
jgi:CTP synthase